MRLAAKIDHAARRGKNPMPAAFAVCLRKRWDNRGLKVLLTKRAESLRYLPGVVTFPGGKADEGDASIEATAQRELREEVGLVPGDTLSTLTPVVNKEFKYIITPVVFKIDPDSEVEFDPGSEVESAEWVGLDQALERELTFPVRSALVETMATLYPVGSQSSTPDAWFFPHNSLSYLHRQLSASIKLVQLYKSWLPFINGSLRPELKGLLEKLISVHTRQAVVMDEFLRANDQRPTAFVDHPLLYLNTLQMRLAVNPSVLDDPARWTLDAWRNVFYGLFVAYHRAFERCLGLRRVLHCDIPFERTESFWPSQWVWSALMMDAYFNAVAIANAFPELRVPMNQSLLFQAEAKMRF